MDQVVIRPHWTNYTHVFMQASTNPNLSLTSRWRTESAGSVAGGPTGQTTATMALGEDVSELEDHETPGSEGVSGRH